MPCRGPEERSTLCFLGHRSLGEVNCSRIGEIRSCYGLWADSPWLTNGYPMSWVLERCFFDLGASSRIVCGIAVRELKSLSLDSTGNGSTGCDTSWS
jgi:hypothetical protein